MKRRLLATLAVVVITFSAVGGEKELPSIEPGQKPEAAEDFRLADLHGVRMQLSKVEAPVVVLHFWS